MQSLELVPETGPSQATSTAKAVLLLLCKINNKPLEGSGAPLPPPTATCTVKVLGSRLPCAPSTGVAGISRDCTPRCGYH